MCTDALGAALLNPGSSMTQHDLENFDTEQKRMDEARRHYRRALDIAPSTGPAEPDRTLRHGWR
jgi:hypothetical protein